MIELLARRMRDRSVALRGSLEAGLGRIMLGWLLIAGLATALRIATSPIRGSIEPATVAPYLLLMFAPLMSMALALRWFADVGRDPQPAIRAALAGRWRQLPIARARRDRYYGTGGLMVSLLIAILLNVPVRAFEYLAAMPALSGPVPEWLSLLHLMMTIDVVLLTSLYAIAYVAALRHVPAFPRMIVAIWALDLGMQIAIQRLMAGVADLPGAVAGPLQSLIEGNVLKVLASISIWLPYLLLSKRVNVTFRHRIRA